MNQEEILSLSSQIMGIDKNIYKGKPSKEEIMLKMKDSFDTELKHQKEISREML